MCQYGSLSRRLKITDQEESIEVVRRITQETLIWKVSFVSPVKTSSPFPICNVSVHVTYQPCLDMGFTPPFIPAAFAAVQPSSTSSTLPALIPEPSALLSLKAGGALEDPLAPTRAARTAGDLTSVSGKEDFEIDGGFSRALPRCMNCSERGQRR